MNDATLDPRATAPFDRSRAPLLVVWETTRACPSSCAHCRAEGGAGRAADPAELTPAEGLRLVDQVAELGAPALLLSGGDPLVRADLEALVRRGKAKGLRVSAHPAASEALTRGRLAALKAAGLDEVAFSLDGATALEHDTFRRTPGSFAQVMAAVRWSHELGLPVRVATCLGSWNAQAFEPLVELASSLPIAVWELFFLVPVGRGAALTGLTPDQCEAVYARLHRLAREQDFAVKLTEGQPYRRFAMLEAAKAGAAAAPGDAERALNAGDGLLFVDHLGGICPSELLPQVRGDVRTDSLAAVYREDALFAALRDHERLEGKCSVCEFRRPCGGSRARAYAVTGNVHATDPGCAYTPAALRKA